MDIYALLNLWKEHAEVVVDAVNNEKVLQFYARNQFWTVFKTEEDERKANELENGQPLQTRFMISDLK